MSKKQTIFRTPKNADHPYVMVNKKGIDCPDLSYRAKGILTYLLSKPDHWKVTIRDLMKHGKEGRDAIYKALKELIHYGYVEQTCSRGDGKINAYHYRVYEQPFSGAEKGLSVTDQDDISRETEVVFQEAIRPSTPSEKPCTDSQDTDFQEEAESLSMMDTELQGEEPRHTPVHPKKLHTKNLHPEDPTRVSNDLENNQLTIHKTRSSHARCVTFELWEETFGQELSIREYGLLVEASHRTLLTKTICLIQQHHNVSSIQSPFAFVYSCVTHGGYQITHRVTASRTQYVKQKRVPLTKDVQMQREGKKFPSPYTDEELEEKIVRIKEQIRMLSEGNGECVTA